MGNTESRLGKILEGGNTFGGIQLAQERGSNRFKKTIVWGAVGLGLGLFVAAGTIAVWSQIVPGFMSSAKAAEVGIFIPLSGAVLGGVWGVASSKKG